MVDQHTEHSGRVLIIAGESSAQRLLVSRVSAAGYPVDAVATEEEARAACAKQAPSLVIIDLEVRRAGGLPLLKQLRQAWPNLPIIAVTNLLGLEDKGVRATQLGAFSYLVKPLERTELLDHVRRAIGPAAAPADEHDWQSDLAARARLREERMRQYNEIAAQDGHFLLTGENGVGRELVARAIHAVSARRGRPLIVLRCGGSSDVEFRPGAEVYSDAVLKALRNARGGSLLIDEIDCLPMASQLTLVQCPLEARLIATSAMQAQESLASGHLHADLYARIGQLTLATPPLGRRREDIPLLISHFLEAAADSDGRSIYTHKEVIDLVVRHWPAHIREVFELVCQHPPGSRRQVVSIAAESISSFDEAREDFSRQYLSETLRMTEGNVSESARLAKRNRTDFYKLMAKYRLRPDDFKLADD